MLAPQDGDNATPLNRLDQLCRYAAHLLQVDLRNYHRRITTPRFQLLGGASMKSKKSGTPDAESTMLPRVIRILGHSILRRRVQDIVDKVSAGIVGQGHGSFAWKLGQGPVTLPVCDTVRDIGMRAS